MLVESNAILSLDDIDAMRNVKMLHPFIPSKSISMFTANAGNLKTSLVLDVVSSILNDNKNMESYWFDFDIGIHRAHKESINNLISTKRFAPIIVSNNDVHDEVNRIINQLSEKEVLSNVVIVVDGLQALFSRKDKDINKSGDAHNILETFKSIKEKGGTVILIHHNNKEEKDGWSNFRGSQVIMDSVDNAYGLKATQGDTEISIDIKVSKYSGTIKEIYQGSNCQVNINKLSNKYSYGFSDECSNEFTISNEQSNIIELVTSNSFKFGKTELVSLIMRDLSLPKNKTRAELEELINKGILCLQKVNKKNKFIIGISEPIDLISN